MAKKTGTILMALFIVLFFGINIFVYLTKGDSRAPISGGAVSNLPFEMNMSIIAFILQWVILLFVVIFAYTKFLKHRKEEESKIAGFVMPELKSKSQTKIDIFYELLKDKKNLGVAAIAKAFKIPKETALEWAKILESHELVVIEYPAFSEPEVTLKGWDESKERKQEKQKNKIKDTYKKDINLSDKKDKIQEKKAPEKNQPLQITNKTDK